MANIRDIFSFRNVAKSIEEVKTGIPDPCPPAMEAIQEKIIGNETTFHTFRGTRQIVNRIEYGAPHLKVTQNSFGQQAIIIPAFGTYVEVEQELILRLRAPDSCEADRKSAMTFIARKVKEHKQRYENNKIAHKVQALSTGIYYYDAAGKLLQTSSGAVATIDMGIPAANRGQAAGIISASWADPNTNIFYQIERLKKRKLQETGQPLKKAFYGTIIPSWIYTNNSFKHYFQFNQQMYGQFQSNPSVIPNGFLELDWVKMGDAFYEQSDLSITQQWPEDQITFTPEFDENWYTQYIGSRLVPTDTGVSSSTDINLENTQVVYGNYGYSWIGGIETGAIGVRLYLGDIRMPTIKNGNVVDILDVAP